MFNNPVLSNFNNLSAYIIFWVLLSVINFTVLIIGPDLEIKYAAADSFIFNAVLALFSLSFWYSAKYISFEKNSTYKIIFSHIAGSLAASALWILISYTILILLFTGTSYSDFLISSLTWRFLMGIIFYFSVTALYYVIIYYSALREKSGREAELKNLAAMAELRSLKFQINPHLIFNSLNSIAALTSIDPVKAKMMSIKLSDFLRYSLANTEKQMVSLKEEIYNINLYLDIERIRFEDKFDYEEDVPEDCLSCLIPGMILQPLIENVVKHAVYEASGKIHIKLYCRRENGFLIVKLSNNFEPGGSLKKGAGIGLKNIAGRIEILYDRKGFMEIKNENAVFTVKLIIPAE